MTGLNDIANGGAGDIPAPSPPKSEQPERAPSQLESSFDLKNHPNPEEDDTRRTPGRASVRVRAPPGGQSSGGFWWRGRNFSKNLKIFLSFVFRSNFARDGKSTSLGRNNFSSRFTKISPKPHFLSLKEFFTNFLLLPPKMLRSMTHFSYLKTSHFISLEVQLNFSASEFNYRMFVFFFLPLSFSRCCYLSISQRCIIE